MNHKYKGKTIAQWKELPFSDRIIQVSVGDERESFFVLSSTALYKWKGGVFTRIDTTLGIQVKLPFFFTSKQCL